jgi:hypothetical protein
VARALLEALRLEQPIGAAQLERALSSSTAMPSTALFRRSSGVT